MRILCISKDDWLLEILNKPEVAEEHNVTFFNENPDPLDVMSHACSMSPTLILADDDFLKPDTVHILKSIRKVNKKVAIIFLTSDDSLTLGREATQIGIHFYGVKPLTEEELMDLLNSIGELKRTNNFK